MTHLKLVLDLTNLRVEKMDGKVTAKSKYLAKARMVKSTKSRKGLL